VTSLGRARLVVETDGAGDGLEAGGEEGLHRIQVELVGGRAGFGIGDPVGADGIAADREAVVHLHVGGGGQRGGGEREAGGEFVAVLHGLVLVFWIGPGMAGAAGGLAASLPSAGQVPGLAGLNSHG
jgi:hypothetical protein